MTLLGYRIVWTFVIFDLPVTSKRAKRNYANFRRLLLDEGFEMLQFSVYARCSPTDDKARVIEARIEGALPPDGRVRIFQLTDRQFGMMKCYFGKLRAKPEKGGEQLELF